MKNHGFLQANTISIINKKKKDIFFNADVIRIIYVSGNNFLNNTLNESIIRKSLSKGKIIKFICASENSGFLLDIENLEIINGYRKEGDTIFG